MERELEAIFGEQNHCLFVAQKLREWIEILNKEDVTKKDKAYIRERVRTFKRAWLDMISTLYDARHGHEKASDEWVSKLYYSYLTDMQELYEHYELWGKNLNSMAAYLETPVCKDQSTGESILAKDLIEALPDKREYESITEKATQLLLTKNPSSWALEFTAQVCNLSESWIQKEEKNYL